MTEQMTEQKIRWHHWADGLWFGREPSGAVRIRVYAALDCCVPTDPHPAPAREFCIPAEQWASVVTAVSLVEDSASYQAARVLHEGPSASPDQ